MQKQLVVIEGATGIGKTATGIELARFFDTEIVSADSRQIFKELFIGTAKPTAEEQALVKHHMINVASIHDYFNAYMFAEQASSCIEMLFKNRDIVIMVGGSGLYIDALCNGIDEIPDIEPQIRESVNAKFMSEGIDGLRLELKTIDPIFYQTVDLNNQMRLIRGIEVYRQTGRPYSSFRVKKMKQVPYKITKIALERERHSLYSRINHRVDEMMRLGLEDEARSLLDFKQLNALQTVGYKELFDYFEGKTSKDEAVELIKRNTRHYAKKQESWFRRDISTIWMNAEDLEKIKSHIQDPGK